MVVRNQGNDPVEISGYEMERAVKRAHQLRSETLGRAFHSLGSAIGKAFRGLARILPRDSRSLDPGPR